MYSTWQNLAPRPQNVATVLSRCLHLWRFG